MKEFVQISNVRENAFCVNPGIEFIDATNVKSPKADRLSIKPAWAKLNIVILPGIGFYPAEIAKWHSVKSLSKNGHVTIGSEFDLEAIPEEQKAKAVELSKKLKDAQKKLAADKALNAKILEADIANNRE